MKTLNRNKTDITKLTSWQWTLFAENWMVSRKK